LQTKNPIATPQQTEFERRALGLLKHPTMKRAIEEVRESWPKLVSPGPDMLKCFARAYEEVVFGAAIWSVNSDKERPAVITISRLAHKLGDLDIPGSRWGLDNPDTVYRVIPISGEEKYLIHGKVGATRLTENYFNLWDSKMNSVAVLNGKDLKLKPDGSFTITVDSSPADGRANHIQSTPTAHEFYIRDVVHDWSKEMINELSIERLGGPPKKAPLSDDEQAEKIAKLLRHYTTETHRWNGQAMQKPANKFDFIIDRDTDGAQRGQIYIMGHFKLTDDEAFVVNLRTGGAEYFIVPITNAWGTTNGIDWRTGSLNKSQSVADADGSYTFVISKKDPGVHNWVDPCDMNEGILTLRWAEFPGGVPGKDLGATGKVVKLTELKSHLPSGTKYLTADERKKQQSERAAQYSWRIKQ